jgi:hypothetical protein
VDESGRAGLSTVDESHIRDIIAIVIGLSVWGILFAAGVIINSGPCRDALGSAAYMPPSQRLRCWFIVITTFTLTNVALLSCFAAVLGAAGQRLRVGLSEDAEVLKGSKHPYAAAIIGGFFIYLAAVSGILVLVEKPWATPTPEQYVRLAGLISLLSFLMGYNPRMLSRFLARIAEIIEGLGKRDYPG